MYLEDDFRDTNKAVHKPSEMEVLAIMIGKMNVMLKKQQEMMKQTKKVKKVHMWR